VWTASQRLVCVLAAMLAASCSQSYDPPRFMRLEVWEGYLANPGLPVLQRRIDAMPDGSGPHSLASTNAMPRFKTDR
jgi:hypothetical protein